MRDQMSATLSIYSWPPQAFWRYFEVKALQQIEYDRPILEIGCGDGQLNSLILDEIDEAIDINPRAVEKCRRLAGSLYREVRCQDARKLEYSKDGYGTIYANCVMEHIPDIHGVLAACYRSLRPGGKLVITVPLLEMNEHLLLPWRWYAKMRQRQLVHVNLFTQEEWENVLRSVGFCSVEFRPYLSGEACRFWDTLDGPGSVGFGRYRLAAVLGRVTPKVLPKIVRERIRDSFSRWFSAKAEAAEGAGPACAVVVMAAKGSGETGQ
jgi:SAM-dependent methyltransferase